jgi:type VI secretion system protein ImpC
MSVRGRHSAQPAAAAGWARARLRELEDRYASAESGLQQLEQQIVSLSLRFGVLCRFTSFVAVDSEVLSAGRPRSVVQPVEPPAGWALPGQGAAASINRKLERVRRPRVHISYEVAVGGAVEKIELPFVVGVVADLSGNPAEALAPLMERKFVDINPDNFDAVFAACAPRLILCLPSRAEGDDLPEIELRFRSLDDFSPDRVSEQAAPLQPLRETNDAGLARHLRAILGHPDFQRLEATWLGLKYLMDQTETGPLLKLRVFNATRAELAQDLTSGKDYRQSALFRRVYEEEFHLLGGHPYTLLVVDGCFDRTPDDLALLAALARVSAAAQTFVVSGVSPQWFGVGSWAELTADRLSAATHALAADDSWRQFRAAPEARHAALALPRVLARPPREGMSADEPDRLWMNTAWVFASRVTTAWAEFGWLAHLTGGRVENLPGNTTELATAATQARDLAGAGLLPLQHDPIGALFFPSAPTCAAPGADPREVQLPHLLAVTRFLHYLLVMARDKLGPLEVMPHVERWLNLWISGSVIANPENAGPELRAKKPLRDARVELCAVPGHPNRYRLTASLQPHFQVEGPPLTLRLSGEVPGRRR